MMRFDYLCSRRLNEFYEFLPEINRKSLNYQVLVRDLSKSATEKYGDNPEKTFKDELNNIDALVEESVKQGLKNDSHFPLEIRDSIVSLRLSLFQAILQVNIEIPGFKDKFNPEIEEYISRGEWYEYSSISEKKIREQIETIYNTFNRFSEKYDLNDLKTTFSIQESDLKSDKRGKNNKRADDYVALNLPKLIKKYGEEKDYLIKNFCYQKDLLPEDYYAMIALLDSESTKVLTDYKKKKYQETSIYWIDQYFKFQDILLDNFDPSDLSVEFIRKINTTRL